MTRTLVIASVLLLVGMVALLVMGLAGQAPAMLIISLLCVLPLFCMALGAALGRASNEFQVVRKASRNPTIAQRLGRAAEREPLS
jgi:hypothetical protein